MTTYTLVPTIVIQKIKLELPIRENADSQFGEVLTMFGRSEA